MNFNYNTNILVGINDNTNNIVWKNVLIKMMRKTCNECTCIIRYIQCNMYLDILTLVVTK